MALATYSDLVAAVSDWLDVDHIAARVPDFIRLTEMRLNRLLEDPEMEIIATLVASGEYTPLPADFGSMISINTGHGPLAAMGSVEFAGIDRTVTGLPRFYTITDGAVSFAPFNSTTPITLVYRRTLPGLSETNASNWLLDRAPDVYLYGTLVQASAFLVEDERVGLWKAAFDEAVQELRIDATRRKWGAGPIAPRINRT